jgi:hypothetical protein
LGTFNTGIPQRDTWHDSALYLLSLDLKKDQVRPCGEVTVAADWTLPPIVMERRARTQNNRYVDVARQMDETAAAEDRRKKEAAKERAAAIKVGRCRLTVSKPALKAPTRMLSALESSHIDKLLSTFAFRIDLRRFIKAHLDTQVAFRDKQRAQRTEEIVRDKVGWCRLTQWNPT